MVGALRAALPRHLQHHLSSGRELAHRQAATSITTLSTTVEALDRLLHGGLPRGQIVELVGHRSSGRFSAVLATLAAATTGGEAAALVDLGDALDPRLAVAAGVVLERLLWVRPQHLKQALISTETLLVGGFPLVVVELGWPPVRGGRGIEAAWLRLARTAESRGAALLVSSPYRASGTAAAGVVRAGSPRSLWCGGARSCRLLLGLASRLSLEKLRGRQEAGEETSCFVLPEAAALGTPVTRNRLARRTAARRSLSVPFAAASGAAERSLTVAATRRGGSSGARSSEP